MGKYARVLPALSFVFSILISSNLRAETEWNDLMQAGSSCLFVFGASSAKTSLPAMNALTTALEDPAIAAAGSFTRLHPPNSTGPVVDIVKAWEIQSPSIQKAVTQLLFQVESVHNFNDVDKSGLRFRQTCAAGICFMLSGALSEFFIPGSGPSLSVLVGSIGASLGWKITGEVLEDQKLPMKKRKHVVVIAQDQRDFDYIVGEANKYDIN